MVYFCPLWITFIHCCIRTVRYFCILFFTWKFMNYLKFCKCFWCSLLNILIGYVFCTFLENSKRVKELETSVINTTQTWETTITSYHLMEPELGKAKNCKKWNFRKQNSLRSSIKTCDFYPAFVLLELLIPPVIIHDLFSLADTSLHDLCRDYSFY